MLRLDDDEIPSHAFLDALPGLVGAQDVTHYQLRRSWVWPRPDTLLDEPPWASEFVPRLFRRDPALAVFPGIFHLPLKSIGPFRWVDSALYHTDLAVNDAAARRAKAEAYERRRPGIRIVGRPLNDAFYVPESAPCRRTRSRSARWTQRFCERSPVCRMSRSRARRPCDR